MRNPCLEHNDLEHNEFGSPRFCGRLTGPWRLAPILAGILSCSLAAQSERPTALSDSEIVQVRTWDRIRRSHISLFQRAVATRPEIQELFDRIDAIAVFDAAVAAGESPPEVDAVSTGSIPPETVTTSPAPSPPPLEPLQPRIRRRGRGGVGNYPVWDEGKSQPLLFIENLKSRPPVMDAGRSVGSPDPRPDSDSRNP